MSTKHTVSTVMSVDYNDHPSRKEIALLASVPDASRVKLRLQRGADVADPQHDAYLQWRKTLLKRKGKKCDRRVFGERTGRYLDTRALLLEKRVASLSQKAPPRMYDTDSTAPLPNTDDTTVWREAEDVKKVNPANAAKAYTFTGIHHMFVHHKKSVTVLRFANDNKDLLAMGSLDRSISICATYHNPHVKLQMKGHEDVVTDLSWSATNEWILSTSFDKTVRLWDTRTGACLRIVHTKRVPLCCLFHPFNNNVYLIGSNNGVIGTYNMSTGKPICAVPVNGAVSAMCMNNNGTILIIGTDKGTLVSFFIEIPSMKLVQLSTVQITGKKVTSVAFREWGTEVNGKRFPELLVNSCDGLIRLLRLTVRPNDIGMEVRLQYPVAHQKYNIKAKFCPLIRAAKGASACFVAGSEAGEVVIYETGKPGSRPITVLLGHGSTTLDVAWNYDESLLASSDLDGLVIVWKRERLVAIIPKNLDK